MRTVPFPLVAAVTVLAACSETIGPEFGLQVSVVARAGDFVEVGDTVELIGVAYNPSGETISAGRGCSPGIGLLVIAPDGEVAENSAAGDHLCPFRDNNAIEPGETDFQAHVWVAPAAGDYTIQSAVLVTDGPDILSPEVPLQVRLPD